MPEIPNRMSSLKARIPAMLKRKRSLEETASKVEKELNTKGSFNASTFWEQLAEVDEKHIKANKLGHKISMIEMNLDGKNADHVKAWQSSEHGIALLEQKQALSRRLSYIIKQKDLFENDDNDASLTLRRSYAKIFIGAITGMNIANSQPRRSALQDQFKRELRMVMGRHPDETPDSAEYWWCPILAEYTRDIRAGHFLAARSGRAAMDAIFGPQEQTEWISPTESAPRKSELFRAVNGIIWSEAAEIRFGKGLFVLIPDVKSDAIDVDLKEWQNSSLKEYKIHIVRPNHPSMKTWISLNNKKAWTTLEGRRVLWNDPTKETVTFRPRARYLYWTYLEAILRKFYESSAREGHPQAITAQKEVGKKYWGSAGSYMQKNMLQGFVEEIGHVYDEEAMMKTPPSESEKLEEATDCGVAIARQAILDKHQDLKAVKEYDWDWSDSD